MVDMEYRMSQNLVVIEEPLEKNNVNQLREILTKTPEPPESLTIDLSKSPMIDTAGIQLHVRVHPAQHDPSSRHVQYAVTGG